MEPTSISRYAWRTAAAAPAQTPKTVAVPAAPSPLSPPRPTPTLPCALTDRLPMPLVSALFDSLAALLAGGHGQDVEEIRLRAGRYISLTVGGRNVMTSLRLDERDLSETLSALCGGSLYAYSQDIAQGFLSLPDGIRVGVAGKAACEQGRVLGLREITGLCIRLPHRRRAVGDGLIRMIRANLAAGSPRGLLVYGPPGIGKTTLLRGMAVGLASPPDPLRTMLVDTRAELCYDTSDPGLCLDVLVGYPRALGVEIATRTLSAQVILCDEIGDCSEAMALTEAHHGGVPLVASAHASGCAELLRRTGLRLLHEAQLFSAYVGLTRDGAGGFLYRVTPWEAADAELTRHGGTL